MGREIGSPFEFQVFVLKERSHRFALSHTYPTQLRAPSNININGENVPQELKIVKCHPKGSVDLDKTKQCFNVQTNSP